MGFFSPLPAPAPPPKLPNPGPALSQDKQSYQHSDASSFAQTSTLHVVGHRAVGGKEVVMQHLIALLGVKDQEAVRKKQDPDSGMNEGGKGPFSPRVTASAVHITEQCTMVQMRLHIRT